mgnify:CR=1 FL=1
MALLFLSAILFGEIMKQTNDWQGPVQMIRRVRTRKGREMSGAFSIEGIRLHERALRAGVLVTQVIATTAFIQDPTPRIKTLMADLRQQACEITVVPDHVIREIIGDRDLGQILGLVKMPEKRKLVDIINDVHNRRPLILVAVDVKDPGNIGAMLRTAHAAAASAFVATGISDPYHPKALRTTMGSLFRLPVVYAEQPLSIIHELQEMGVESVATVVSSGISLHQAKFSENGTAVFIGSEAWGLPADVIKAVDRLVSIPMIEEVDSFSVNAAAAIVLYDIGRKWELSRGYDD